MGKILFILLQEDFLFATCVYFDAEIFPVHKILHRKFYYIYFFDYKKELFFEKMWMLSFSFVFSFFGKKNLLFFKILQYKNSYKNLHVLVFNLILFFKSLQNYVY